MKARQRPQRALLDPLAVALVALVTRAVAAAGIRFPIPEDSAYYVDAARNLATGRGLVVDALWSYATPPLALPHPAFDLWQPLASLIAAPFMALFGTGLASAQLPTVVLGAVAASLAWAIGRDAAIQLGLEPARVAAVALGSGLLVAVTPLLVLQGAESDSSAPFTILALTVCWLIPRALTERSPMLRWRLCLGVVLGLAYLARQEAIYLLAAYLLLAWMRDRGPGLGRAAVPLLAGAIVIAPWLLRQAFTWERPPLAQLLENAWLVRNEDIFAWANRPSLSNQMALGIPGLIDLRASAMLGNLGTVMVAGFPAGAIGLGTLILRPRLAALPAMSGLTIYALVTFLVVGVVFPVAGRAGLFGHASGPILVMLAVAAAIGIDASVGVLARLRNWRVRRTSLVGLTLFVLALPLLVQAVALDASRSALLAQRYRALSQVLPATNGSSPVISDHPIWLTVGLGVPALALPAENASAVLDLAARFGARSVLVDAVSDWPPDASTWAPCLTDMPATAGFRLFRIDCPAASP